MDFVFVAMFEGRPIAAAHTKKDIEMLLAGYTQGTLVEYRAHESKYPSDFEGTYYYTEGTTNEILEFRIILVDYLREDQE